MIRIRSQKLLSGVSVLAVMAAFGAVDSALAGNINSGTNPNPPVSVTGTTNFININAGAIVSADGLGNSFTNTGSIFGSATALFLNQAVLQGGISNQGYMAGSSDGINITNSSVVDGDITNSGSIFGDFYGVRISNSVVTGAINNTGTTALIQASTAGILLTGNAVVVGGITNAGTISGINGSTTANGIELRGNSVLTGGIVNSGTISGQSDTNAYGINLHGSAVLTGGIENTGHIVAFNASSSANAIVINTSGALVGDINNSGLISATSALFAAGINLQSGVIAGSIINQDTGSITASNAGSAVAILLAGGTLAGNIDNSGLISGQDIGISVTGATIAGSIVNNAGGIISATTTGGVAISISGGTVAGGIHNAGSILADTSSGVAISVSGAGSLIGGITNSGTAALIRANSTAISISVATFNGDITNEGSIVSGSADAILITSATAFNGNITNAEGAVIQADSGRGIYVNNALATFTGTIANSGLIESSSDAIRVNVAAIVGDVVNTSSGVLTSSSGDGIEIDATTMSGDVTNDGLIGTSTTAVNDDGMDIDGTTLTGNVTNNGTIFADDDGIIIQSGLTITGDVTNTGEIFADVENAGAGSGIDVQGVIQGSIVNSGLISADISVGGTGINVDGQVDGGITNSGTILGSDRAINLSGADTGTDIRQTAGLIQGRNGTILSTALDLTNGFNDTFHGNGGQLDGDVLADASDDFLMAPSGTFAYVRGTATGLDLFNKSGSGTALLGTDTRGVDGEGVTVTAVSSTLSAGRLYLDDNSTINAGTFTQTGGTLEYFLTSNTAQHGVVNSGAAINQNNLVLSAFIDPATMALGGGVNTYDYNDVIDATGARTGVLPGTTVATSSVFFTGTILTLNDTDDIDIQLNRRTFAGVFGALGITPTQNQTAVGGALETIYSNVSLSPEMEDLFVTLFGAGLTGAQIQTIFDELSGSQHAQIQQQTLSVTNIFNNMVGERLDGILVTEDGTRMSALVAKRYAQAVGATASDATGGMGSQGMTRGSSGMSVWLRGLGQWVNVDGDSEASGYQQDTNGLVGGVDVALNPNVTVGAAASYATTNTDFDTSPDNADIDSWQGGLYGSYGLGNFYIDGVASYASHDVSATRFIPVGSVFAASSYNATAWSLNGEVGAIWRLGRVNVQPAAALNYTAASTDGFTETGAGNLGLTVAGSDSDSFASTLSVRAAGQWMMARTPVVPDLKIGWRHEFGDDRQSFTATFLEDSSVPFTIVSSNIQPDSLVISTGLTAGVTKNFEVFFDVNGQYAADASATNASGGLRFTW